MENHQNMSTNNNSEDYIKFLNQENNEEDIYVSFSFHVQLNDSLIMFHVCHLYHNCIKLIDTGEMKYDEIDDIMNISYVLKSVQEALDNRIKCMSSSYIDDAYQWCLSKPDVFDKCLDYFKKIKSKVSELKEEQKLKNLLESAISTVSENETNNINEKQQQ